MASRGLAPAHRARRQAAAALRRAAGAGRGPRGAAAGRSDVRAPGRGRAGESATARRSGRSRSGSPALALLLLSLGSLFILTLPCSVAAWVLAVRARRQIDSGATKQGEGQATAALWLGRIGVIAGVAAMVVFIALVASGFDFEQFRDDLEQRARPAPRAPGRRRRRRRAHEPRPAARGGRRRGSLARLAPRS